MHFKNIDYLTIAKDDSLGWNKFFRWKLGTVTPHGDDILFLGI